MFTQKELNDAIVLCKSQLKELGYDVPSITQYKTTNRMTRALGNCATRTIRATNQLTSCIITLSNDMTAKIMPTTLMHEMIHTIYPHDGHGYYFQSLARKVNKAYGYDVDVKAVGESRDVIREVRQAKMTQIACSGCGTISSINPNTKLYRNAMSGLCTCRKCKGKDFHKV